jgi:outer membrane protein TolC
MAETAKTQAGRKEMKLRNPRKAARIGALFAASLATALAASPEASPLAAPLGAQTRLGADEAASMAAANNEGLKQAALALESKRRALGLAWNSLLPSLTASAGLAESGSTPASSISPAMTLAATGGLSLSLNLSASYAEDKKLLRLAYEHQLIAYAQAKAELELSVRKSIFAILLDTEKLKLSRQNIEREEASYAQTEAKYKAGLAPELDLLTAKVSLETLKPEAEAYATTLANDLDALKSALDIAAENEISVIGSLEPPEDAIARVLESAAAKGESENLSVAAAAKALEIAGATKLSLERSKLLPSLALGASATPSVPFLSMGAASSSLATSASAILSFPLDNYLSGSAARQKIAEAQDSVDIDASVLKAAIRSTQVSRKADRRSVESYRSSLAALKLNAELAQRAYDASREAYQKGYTTLTSLQTAVGSLESAKLSVLSKSYDLIAAVLDLEYETGLPLDSIGRF